MTRQCGRRGFVVATVVVFIFIFAALQIREPSRVAFSIPSFSYFGLGQVEPISGTGPEKTRPTEEGDAAIHSDPPAIATTNIPTPQDDGSDELTTALSVALNSPATATSDTPSIPTSTELSKIIVMGKIQGESTDWVDRYLGDWENAIYQVDVPALEESPTGFRTKINKAKEAMPYLTYIVDHYPKFPNVVAFLHAHRKGYPNAWHNDAPNHDAVNMMNMLRLDTVVSQGYVNLRCLTDIGCPREVQPFRNPPDQDKHAEHAFPYFYAHFFSATTDEMKERIPIVATPCCAQFAVSREQILQRPKQDYERYITFLEETTYDDDTAGRVMEYMWHIIFGRDAVFCPNQFQCKCAVYGQCRVGMKGLTSS